MAGTSGAGKTTTARRLSERLGIPHTEIDSLFHGPNWEPLPSFQADVDAFTSQDAWVMEFQYNSVHPVLAQRADTLVWLHFRRTTVMRRLISRTVRRRLTRQELWNGNVESPLHMILTDRDHIVRWGWRTHAGRQQQVRDAIAANPHLQLVELRDQREGRPLARCPLGSEGGLLPGALSQMLHTCAVFATGRQDYNRSASWAAIASRSSASVSRSSAA